MAQVEAEDNDKTTVKKGHGPWILLVEDDRFTAKMYSAKFSHDGIDLKVAEDEEQMLALLKESLPAVIFLDLILPKKNGFEILEDLKKDSHLKNIPILILSNLGQKSDIERGLSLGAKEYLNKTDVRIEDVVSKAKKYMGA